MFASFVIGAPVNPLDSSFMCDDIVHIFKETKPKIIFCDDDKVNEVQKAICELKYEIAIVCMNQRIDGYDFIDDFINDDVKIEECKIM